MCNSIKTASLERYDYLCVRLLWNRLSVSDWRGKALYYRFSLCSTSPQFGQSQCIERKLGNNWADFQIQRNVSHLAILQAESTFGVNNNIEAEKVTFLCLDGLHLSLDKRGYPINWRTLLMFNTEIIEMNKTHVLISWSLNLAQINQLYSIASATIETYVHYCMTPKRICFELKIIYSSAKAFQFHTTFHREKYLIEKRHEEMSEQFDARRYAIGFILSDPHLEKRFNETAIKVYSGLHFFKCGYQATGGQMPKFTKSNEMKQTFSPLFLNYNLSNLHLFSFEMECRIEILWRTFSCVDFNQENTSFAFPIFPNKFSIWECDPKSPPLNDTQNVSLSVSVETLCQSRPSLVWIMINNGNINSPTQRYFKETLNFKLVLQILYMIEDLNGNLYLVDNLPVYYCNWWIIPLRFLFLFPNVGLIVTSIVARYMWGRCYTWRTIRRARARQVTTPANSLGPESLSLYDYSNQQELLRHLDLPDQPNPDLIFPETEFNPPTKFSECEPGKYFTGTEPGETQTTSFQTNQVNTKYIRPLGRE